MKKTEKYNVVGWFEIYVTDMKRAKKFYEAVFSKKLEKLENPDLEMWAFNGDMNAYGAPGALVKMPGFAAGKNSVLVYFSCKNCRTEEKRVLKAGGKIQRSKFSIGQYGYISLVFDTEGNMFGLHSLS
jgi:predicted enzyme related to lactoylglutathione lyase